MAQHASGIGRRLPDLGRWAQAVVVLLLAGLLVAMALGPLQQLVEQRKRISAVSNQLDELSRNNAALEDRIERLQDPDYIEQEARAQAGLVRPGEIPFVVMPPSKAQRAEKEEERRRTKAAAEQEPEPSLLRSFVTFLGF